MTAFSARWLALSIFAFVVLTGWLSGRIGTWHEEVSVLPSDGAVMLGGSAPSLSRGCADRASPRWVVSRSRPVWSLCAGGRSLPIMVTSYFAGWIYWPFEALRVFHHDNVVRLRWLAIALGVLELFFTWMLLRRVASADIADACVIAVALSTPYVFVHALLVPYEVVPWMFVGCALLLCLPPGNAALSRSRFLAGAGVLGLALAGNIKTVFLVGPLLGYAWFTGVRVPAALRRLIPVAVLMALAPLVPVALFASIDPMHGFASQLSHRTELATHKIASLALFREPLNLMEYWSDVGAYGDQIQGLRLADRWTWFFPLLSLAHCLRHALRAMRRRPHEIVSALSGLLVGVYIVVVVLLYDQQPEANYAPLHTVLGVATGACCAALGRWIAARLGAPARARSAAIALACVAAMSFAYNSLKRGDPADTVDLPINATAQHQMIATLLSDRERGDVLTTTYNLAGVPDSLSGERVRSVQAHAFFAACDAQSGASAARCLESRWVALLGLRELRRPLSVLVPVRGTIVDERYASDLAPTLERAVLIAGLRVERHDVFATGRGVPVLARYRVR